MFSEAPPCFGVQVMASIYNDPTIGELVLRKRERWQREKTIASAHHGGNH